MKKFANIFTSFFESLEKNGETSVRKVVSSLKLYGSYKPVYGGEEEPFLRDKLKSLPENPEFVDVSDIVLEYCSFFDYDLLSYLVEFFGSDKDNSDLGAYEKSFEEYAKRKVYECPSEVGEVSDSEQERTVVVKLDHHYEGCSLNTLINLRKKICDILSIKFMKLCRVERGCICLTFQLPSHVLDAILPLTDQQKELLSSLHVLFIMSGDYVYESKVSV